MFVYINCIALNQTHRPQSGSGGSGGSASRDMENLSSPMRARVEIVSRKSDHICVVRDVPDRFNSWCQQHSQMAQLQATPTHQVSPCKQQQQSSPTRQIVSSPSKLQQESPLIGCQLARPLSPTQVRQVQDQTPKLNKQTIPSTISEEPTTPGGSLIASVEPSASAALPVSPRPFAMHPPRPERHNRSPSRTACGTASCLSPTRELPNETGDQLSQLVSILNELRADIKTDINHLARKITQIDSRTIDLVPIKQEKPTLPPKTSTPTAQQVPITQQDVAPAPRDQRTQVSSSSFGAKQIPAPVATQDSTLAEPSNPRASASQISMHGHHKHKHMSKVSDVLQEAVSSAASAAQATHRRKSSTIKDDNKLEHSKKSLIKETKEHLDRASRHKRSETLNDNIDNDDNNDDDDDQDATSKL